MNGLAKGAQLAYKYVIAAFVVGCVVQFFLAGRGVFGIRGAEALSDQSSLDPHRMLGNVLAGLAVIVFLCALLLRDQTKIVWTGTLVVLSEAVQHLTAEPSDPWLSGLHPVSGIAILAIGGMLAHRAWHARS
ncbi:MAG: hypothetical protein F2663_05090 [Actinobacteria bacterium]|uniref:Unannotated protein n=1 Tax=freshwater metagenome TaxID=449393 RepID=A0A6J6PC08_9ZZZZ|nr:hypothetical protein [Actinomycetota bacterium]